MTETHQPFYFKQEEGPINEMLGLNNIYDMADRFTKEIEDKDTPISDDLFAYSIARLTTQHEKIIFPLMICLGDMLGFDSSNQTLEAIVNSITDNEVREYIIHEIMRLDNT